MSLHVEVPPDALNRIKPAVAILKAFDCRDTETFVHHMTEDVVFRPSAFIAGRTEYRGRDEVRSGFDQMFADLDARKERCWIAVLAHYVDGEDDTKVLSLVRVTIAPAGAAIYRSELAYLATLRDGRVSDLETWPDHDAGLNQLKTPIAVG